MCRRWSGRSAGRGRGCRCRGLAGVDLTGLERPGIGHGWGCSFGSRARAGRPRARSGCGCQPGQRALLVRARSTARRDTRGIDIKSTLSVGNPGGERVSQVRRCVAATASESSAGRASSAIGARSSPARASAVRAAMRLLDVVERTGGDDHLAQHVQLPRVEGARRRGRDAAAPPGAASACCIARATSSVRLPSSRSSPAGLPGLARDRRTRRARRRAAGTPHRAGNAYAAQRGEHLRRCTRGGGPEVQRPLHGVLARLELRRRAAHPAGRSRRVPARARRGTARPSPAGASRRRRRVRAAAGCGAANRASDQDSNRSPSRIAAEVPNAWVARSSPPCAMQCGERSGGPPGRPRRVSRGVHQVVVHERAGVQQLQAGRGPDQSGVVAVGPRVTERQPQYAKQRPQPLAAVEHDAPGGVEKFGQLGPTPASDSARPSRNSASTASTREMTASPARSGAGAALLTPAQRRWMRCRRRRARSVPSVPDFAATRPDTTLSSCHERFGSVSPRAGPRSPSSSSRRRPSPRTGCCGRRSASSSRCTRPSSRSPTARVGRRGRARSRSPSTSRPTPRCCRWRT